MRHADLLTLSSRTIIIAPRGRDKGRLLLAAPTSLVLTLWLLEAGLSCTALATCILWVHRCSGVLYKKVGAGWLVSARGGITVVEWLHLADQKSASG